MGGEMVTSHSNRTNAVTSPHSTLRELLALHRIDLDDAPFLDTSPSALPDELAWDRVEGMLLGVAIGDSLGRRSEGMLPHERRERYGEIRDYPVHARAGYRAQGVPSDDTQLTFWTLELLLEEGRLAPENLMDMFASRRIKGIGGTVKRALKRYRSEAYPWFEAGLPSAGNGALMRIAPLLLPYLRRPSRDLWADVAIDAMCTHNDAASTAACIAYASILWSLLGRKELPSPEWWLDRYVSVAAPLEGSTHGYRPRRGVWEGLYTGPMWGYVQERVSWAWSQNVPTLEACNLWYSGAYLMETLPCVLYILMRYAHDPEEAIVRAVNDTKDNDTVASIVGAAVGALHGAQALPGRWRANLTGRTLAGGPNHQDRDDVDDGRIFELLEAARVRWG